MAIQMLYPHSFLYLTPTERYKDGFRIFNLELWDGEKKVDSMAVLSGAATTQYSAFVNPEQDYSGSLRCLPEGKYVLGELEDAGAGGSWGDAIGRWWTSVDADPKVNDRANFGIHDDANREYSRGSAGCVCPFSADQMNRIVGWLSQKARPTILICNLGLGWLLKNGISHPGSDKETGHSAEGRFTAALEDAFGFIADKEGYSDNAYPDPGTGGEPWTIGYGTTTYPDGRSVSPGETATPGEAYEWLEFWVGKLANTLKSTVPDWDSLSVGQMTCLISFSYNTGWRPKAEGFGTLNRAIANKAWKDVPAALRLYVNPGTTVEQGLKARREEEIRYWLS